MIYPDYVLEILRQRARLDRSDDSQDARFEAYEPREALREICAWKLGDPAWAGQFEEWAQDCGLALTDASTPPQQGRKDAALVGTEAWERHVWMVENKHRLVERVRTCQDYERLRQIAAILDA